MKKLLFALSSLLLLNTGCETDEPVVKPSGYVPNEAVGRWMYGSFSMSDFWSYNGTYQGKPFELAVVFDFKNDGTYEKYFVASARDYSSCRTEAFTYEKGYVKFDEADGSFTTKPSEGRYRGFYSCIPSKNVDRKHDNSELTDQTYYYEMKTGSNGKPTFIVRFKRTDTNTSTFLPTSW